MKKLLGVTGCPTGIAHTYMAEEALKEAAKKLGAEMKVETNGAVGVENALTAEDIAECDGIIVACDKNVDMKRFNGKKVIEVSVSEGINKAEELVQAMLDGKAPVYGGSEAKAEVKEETVETGNTSVAHQIYKHLMNGVSHMLPFVVAGGVLTAISFLWGIYSFDPTSDQYNVIAATIKTVGGTSMGLMVPIFAACITPPLIIAIAATISKKKFSKADRAAAYVNYILGCTHITEGAIPFAAKDPVRVLPILMVGSSISAIATYIMKVQVPAPHGGFLILPLVHPAITWVLCILAGSVVGAILYVLTAKDVEE